MHFWLQKMRQKIDTSTHLAIVIIGLSLLHGLSRQRNGSIIYEDGKLKEVLHRSENRIGGREHQRWLQRREDAFCSAITEAISGGGCYGIDAVHGYGDGCYGGSEAAAATRTTRLRWEAGEPNCWCRVLGIPNPTGKSIGSRREKIMEKSAESGMVLVRFGPAAEGLQAGWYYLRRCGRIAWTILATSGPRTPILPALLSKKIPTMKFQDLKISFVFEKQHSCCGGIYKIRAAWFQKNITLVDRSTHSHKFSTYICVMNSAYLADSSTRDGQSKEQNSSISILNNVSDNLMSDKDPEVLPFNNDIT
ncbi:hypothetical protein EJB05_09352 [Eragrostis curvula]|uniref:Uncharacterized protein n=1 Tax=Eragrostis curvula TaxID=38414 RepID=A0A5J9W4R8_9POAL|nr:hypothetical protein EJB05_09352 [Eragrostis curvula]